MKNRLRVLYTAHAKDRAHEWKKHHDAFAELYAEVDQKRQEIKNKGYQLSREDEPFLERLIKKGDNGVASVRASALSDEVYNRFVDDREFLSALEKLILLPDRDTLLEFTENWQRITRKTVHHTRIHRVVAACTLDVSATVGKDQFDKALSWLVTGGYIEPYPEDEKDDWFSKNVYLMTIFKETFADQLEAGETDGFYLSQFVWKIYDQISNPFRLKKQMVMYGAPGTGKTYQAKEQTKRLFSLWKAGLGYGSDLEYEDCSQLVQFHPSFSYEDFIEGLRPELVENEGVQLTLQNGLFKAFCREAAKWELDVHDLGLRDWESLTIEDLKPFRDQLSKPHWNHVFAIEDSSTLVSQAVPPFFFIIDEINRAELSRVFGELMYCLEYRGAEHSIKTQYANLNTEGTAMLKTKQGWQFFIPTNVYLIGTMNTIDRSIESFDFALRRRFHWEEVRPDIELLRSHLPNTWVGLADGLKRLNDEITNEPLLGPDYQIGHAYCMNLDYMEHLTLKEVRDSIWEDSIRPLLQEYLRGTGKDLRDFKEAFEGDRHGSDSEAR